MFTIDESRMTISWATAMTARASQRFGSGSSVPVGGWVAMVSEALVMWWVSSGDEVVGGDSGGLP